jgi:hypothetical protein
VLQLVAAKNNLHGVWYASSKASTTICWISVKAGDVTDVNIQLW